MSAVADARPDAGAAPGARRSVRAARAGLMLVGLAQAEIAIWGLVAPHSFFRTFPGAGHSWVSALGPYNEHLLRDYAATELGLAVLMLGAAVWFSRRVVLLACSAFLAATVPHFAYHLTTTGSFSTADDVASLGAFVLELVLVVVAMVVAVRSSPERSSV